MDFGKENGGWYFGDGYFTFFGGVNFGGKWGGSILAQNVYDKSEIKTCDLDLV